MSNKKIIMSVTATAAIAASFAAADQASAASYKVKSGDSLWSIASNHDTSVSSLKSTNKLSSSIIYPNQVLETSKKSSSNSSKTSTKSSQSSSSTTYTVKSGDSLSKIASQHSMSLSSLMSTNNLSNTLIYVGDKLNVSGKASSSNSSSSASNKTTSSTPSKNATSYKVKSGDTLGKISKSHGVSVSSLKSLNGLRSDMIYVGQSIKINGSKASSSSSKSSSSNSSSSNVKQTSNATSSSSAGIDVSTLISTAKAQLGSPYVWGGSAPGGFDCSGFIDYTYNKAGKSMGRTSAAGYHARSHSTSNPQVGDMIFFKDTYKSGISHLGIYLGAGNFIHAGGDRVQITSVNNPYWSKHFAGYRSF